MSKYNLRTIVGEHFDLANLEYYFNIREVIVSWFCQPASHWYFCMSLVSNPVVIFYNLYLNSPTLLKLIFQNKYDTKDLVQLLKGQNGGNYIFDCLLRIYSMSLECLSLQLFVCMSVNPSACLPPCLLSVHLFVHPSVCLSACQSDF